MQYINVQEEEIKNKVTINFFGKFDCTEIIRDIDSAVKIKHGKGGCLKSIFEAVFL